MWRGQNRKLNRKPGYDYSSPGFYFITICVRNMSCIFGNVVNGCMNLNEYGKIVDETWMWLEKRYNYIHLDDYIIMPNHIHGIIIIENSNVGRGRDLSLQNVNYQKIKPLSQIIGAFKTISSKQIHNMGYNTFLWQRSFYDNIIRNEYALYKIQKYIKNNPKKWDYDRNKPNKRLF